MAAPAKINADNYQDIKKYASEHTINQSSAKFNISKSSISRIRNCDTYEKYSRTVREEARKYYLARRADIKAEVSSGPFDDATKPEPIIPSGQSDYVDKNGPVHTRKITDSPIVLPMTYEQYKESYEAEMKKNAVLNDKIKELKCEIKGLKVALQNSYDEKGEWEKRALSVEQELTKARDNVSMYRDALDNANAKQAHLNERTSVREKAAPKVIPPVRDIIEYNPNTGESKLKITMGGVAIEVSGGSAPCLEL